VKLGTTWIDLAYNPATGRYEGYLTPSGTSYHQPGGYFSLEAEAVNETGRTAAASGETLAGLRLVARETAAPELKLISPAAGYLATQTPTLIFEATDEENGSGVDPGSFAVLEERTRASPRTSYEPIPGGFRFTWTPPAAWGEGPHTVTASVADHDGNLATVSAAYFVDTIPPTVEIKGVIRHVVDTDRVRFTVDARDGGSGVERVTVEPPAGADGAVPLEVGENHIVVTVTDKAGNTATGTLYMIRLITDRTAFDVEKVRELCQRGMDRWSAEETAWFNAAIVRGAYNDTDLNRVGTAVRYLAGELAKLGYNPAARSKTDWTMRDVPTESPMRDYLGGVEAVVTAQPLFYLLRQPLPETMRELDITGANQIEEALTMVEEPFSRYRSWTSGEITCGGY